MAGNFHETCELESIRIDDGRFLRCLVRREDGELTEAEIDLNCCIGNENGQFEWGRENFSESAEDIRVDIEAGQPILRAVLRREDGEFDARDLNLTERISNQDGRLCFN
ncbi:hypothetical protein N0V93_004698 [Gnomoniopsis smithogilvyi]|uniref:Cyanovirin-N domain-containing protein n=1 Tax=Gnomoniopsis smithogilvyi TaxID=1191159 RepID=A0A9W9CXD2_9PEZI|nr:hypothetical protein N0V93_004698 [Gnomoniopsis smithogilvyi]